MSTNTTAENTAPSERLDKIVLKVHHIVRHFKLGKQTVRALDDVSFEVSRGGFTPWLSSNQQSNSCSTTFIKIGEHNPPWGVPE